MNQRRLTNYVILPILGVVVLTALGKLSYDFWTTIRQEAKPHSDRPWELYS